MKLLAPVSALALCLIASVHAAIVEQGYFEMGDADQPTAGAPGALTTRDVSIFRRDLTRVGDLGAGIGAPVVLAIYNGNTASGATDPALTAAGVVDTVLSLGNAGNTSLDLQSSAAPTPPSQPYLRFVLNSGTVNSTNEATSVSSNSYISFTVTAADSANTSLYLTSLTLNAERGGSTTPRGFNLRSSVDNFASDLVGTGNGDIGSQRPTYTSFQVDLSGSQFQNLSDITFRIYGFGPASGNSVDFDDITLRGAVAAIQRPTDPIVVISAPPTSGSNSFPREGDLYSTQFGPNGAGGNASSRHYEYDIAGVPAPLITNTDNFGVEGYIYLTSLNTGTAIPIFNGNPNDTGWGFAIDPQQNLSGRIGTGSGAVDFGSYHLPLNQWVHVAFVRNAGRATLYVNGAVAGTDTVDVPSFSSAISRPMTLQIGASFADRSTAFPGLVDETRVFTFQPGQFNSAVDLLERNLGATGPSPQPPANLALTGLTSTSTTLGWNPSPGPAQNPNFSTVTTYAIMELAVVGGSNVYTAAAPGLTSPGGSVGGLTAGSVHSWVVQAFADTGDASVPSQPLTVTNPHPFAGVIGVPISLPNGTFQFPVHGAPNQTALVQATSDLTNPASWVTIQSLMPGVSTFTISDSGAVNFKQRFYRVTQP